MACTRKTLKTFSGLIGEVAEDAEKGTLTFDLNLPVFSGDNNFKGRLVAHTKPTLFKPLESALPEAARAARKEELEKQLDNFADTTVEFSYNVTNSSHGRGSETHRRYNLSLPDDGVELMLEGSHKWTFSGAYGRLLSVDEQGNSTSRVDVKASYEARSTTSCAIDVSSPRFTITKKFGDLPVPFGVVFANKPEFLGDVDGKLTALIGLKFDISE